MYIRLLTELRDMEAKLNNNVSPLSKKVNEDEKKDKLAKKVESLEKKLAEVEAEWEKWKGSRQWRFGPQGKKTRNRILKLGSDLRLAKIYLEQGYDPADERPKDDLDTQVTADFFKRQKMRGGKGPAQL